MLWLTRKKDQVQSRKLQPPHGSKKWQGPQCRWDREELLRESKQEEVRLVAEAAAALHPNGSSFVGTTESEQADGRLVVEAAAATAVHHLDTDTNAATTDSEHEEKRLVVEAATATPSIGTEFERTARGIVAGAAAALDLNEDANTTTATCALNEDTNAAAAIEKGKRRDVMSKSEENQNETTSEGDDEVEED